MTVFAITTPRNTASIKSVASKARALRNAEAWCSKLALGAEIVVWRGESEVARFRRVEGAGGGCGGGYPVVRV